MTADPSIADERQSFPIDLGPDLHQVFEDSPCLSPWRESHLIRELTAFALVVTPLVAEEVEVLAPRSTYASGKGATAAGLTAAAVADDFGDAEWGLEAGALVLADGGVACIDEIDKINDTAVSSLHDALESQKVRVNKAGINATLNSRTAMLAAGNPKYGRFDKYEPIAEQLDLGPTLMSRFDLMFMVSDSPDEETDRRVVNHQMRSRRAEAGLFFMNAQVV